MPYSRLSNRRGSLNGLKARLGGVGRRVQALAAGDVTASPLFDPRAYAALNPDLAFANDREAEEHFLRHGLDELRPCSFQQGFSPDFYRAYYPRLAQLTPAQAYRDWLTLGHREGRLASEAALMRALGFSSDARPAAFSAETYRSENPDLVHLSDPQVFEHFVRYGVREMRHPPLGDPGAAAFLTTLGDLYAVQGDRAVATWCFEQALSRDPSNAAALQGYADLELNADRNFVARTLYAAADDAAPGQFWTLVNHGVANEKLGQRDEAIACYRRARDLQPAQEFLRARLRSAAATRFDLAWGEANRIAAAGDRTEARSVLREAVGAYLQAVDEALTSVRPLRPPDARGPRVAILASDSLGQCLHYRVLQKVEHLQAAGLEVSWLPYGRAAEFRRTLHAYDVAIFYRVPATPDVMDAIVYARRIGLATIYEIDDLIFDEANYPPPLESFAGLVSAEEYPGLVTGATLFAEAMRLCDFGLASTPPLQAAIAPLVRQRRCFLHRNGMGAGHHRVADTAPKVRAARRSPSEVVAIFGSGSRSHNENFDACAAPAVAAVMARRPELRLKIIGHLRIGPELAPYRARIEHIPFVPDTLAYWREVAGADINLAPLTSGLFNDCKSEIKWLEAAMAGVPSVVSGSAVYRETLRDGVDAMLADDVIEWADRLERLVIDAGLRARIGAQARERALQDYGLNAMAASAKAAVQSAWRLHQKGPAPRRKARLLFVNVYFAPQTIGGATRVVEDNVRELQRRYGDEFELEVFCSREDGAVAGDVQRYGWNGVGVTALTSHGPSGSAPETSEGNAAVFSDYLAACRPDLVHFHAIQGLTASVVDEARRAGIPYVVTPHDGWWMSDHQFLLDGSGRPVPESGAWGDPARRARLSAGLSGAEAVVAVSGPFGALLRERGAGNVIDCHNGVAPLGPVPPPPLGPQVRLGLLGGLGAAKGADLLRRTLSLAAFPNLAFVVVDHLAAAFSRRVEVWGRTPVEILGKTPQTEVGRLYGELNVVLAPSLCVESFGLVAREALAHGRWVVASNRGAIGEDVVDGENGFVIDVSDPSGLLGALRKIDADPDRYRRSPPGAVKLRTSADQADDLAALYNAILDRRIGRAAPAGMAVQPYGLAAAGG